MNFISRSDMIEFDSEDKAIESKLNEAEAQVFIKFLEAEIRRHSADITGCMRTIKKLREKFGIDEKACSKTSSK